MREFIRDYGLHTILLVLLIFFSLSNHKKISETSADNSIKNTEVVYEDEMHQTKQVALTFDDGPHPVYTPKLLDGLKTRNIQVTFFVTGQSAVLYPELIQRMKDEGHVIGNHTYTHLQLTNSNREEFRTELIRTNQVIRDIIGEDPIFVRPPFGSWDKKFEKELNMFPVLWNIDTLDWSSQNTQKILRRGTCKVEENDIILMHDEYETTVEAAFLIIECLQKEGFEFVTVDKLLFG